MKKSPVSVLRNRPMLTVTESFGHLLTQNRGDWSLSVHSFLVKKKREKKRENKKKSLVKELLFLTAITEVTS